MKEIRPSSLPKLAACPVFVGASGSSEAAERGTRIDLAIRNRIAQIDFQSPAGWTIEDNAPTHWGIRTLRELAQGEEIETREEYLGMQCSRLSTMGTADALCKGRKWLADVKTGQVRNYREQMAAYCMACMEMFFEDRWTAHVVYVDQRLVRSYEFTYEEAGRIVEHTISRATSTLARPTPNEYCTWCANFNSCSALVHQSQEALANVHATSGHTVETIRGQIMASVESMGAFLTRWRFVEKHIAGEVEKELRKELEGGTEVDGWKLTKPTTRRFIEPADFWPVVKMMSPEQAFYAGGGKMSANNFVEAATSLGIENPEQLVKTAPGTSQMRSTKTKAE